MKIPNLFKRRSPGRPPVIVPQLRAGQSVTPAERLSAVYGCVHVLSEAMASLPVRVYRRDACGHNAHDPAHPLSLLLAAEPNPVMTMHTMVDRWMQCLCLKGNGYAFIQRGPRGRVVGIHYLHPDDVAVDPPTYIDEPPTYTVNGLSGEVPACDMVHLMNQTLDGFEGVSTLRYASESTRIAGYAAGAARDFYESGGSVSGILSSDMPLQPRQQDQVRRQFLERGGGGRQGPPVLPYGLKYQPIAVTPRDAQLLESRKYSVEEICHFFRVSPQKIFDFTHSSYSTVEAVELAFLNDTLRPLIVKFEQELTRKLLTPQERAEGVCVRFDTTQLLRADKAAQAQYYSTLFNIGVMSPNDIRRDLDLGHVEGGDRHFVPVNLAELARAGRPDPSDGDGRPRPGTKPGADTQNA